MLIIAPTIEQGEGKRAELRIDRGDVHIVTTDHGRGLPEGARPLPEEVHYADGWERGRLASTVLGQLQRAYAKRLSADGSEPQEIHGWQSKEPIRIVDSPSVCVPEVITVQQTADGCDLFMDGELFPWAIGEAGVRLDVSRTVSPHVTVDLAAIRVEVLHSAHGERITDKKVREGAASIAVIADAASA